MSTPRHVEIKASPIAGNGLFATKAVAPGDIVLELERPLIALLDEDKLENTCAYCFASNGPLDMLNAGGEERTLSRCGGCKKIFYCSKRCQSLSWKLDHKRQCKEWAAYGEPPPNLVTAVVELSKGIASGKPEYLEVNRLENHLADFRDRGASRWQGMVLMSRAACASCKLPVTPENERRMQTLMGIVMSNSFNLVTPTFDTIGLVMDPAASTMNHSCSPNVIMVFDGSRLQVRALEPLKAGQEVLTSYTESNNPFRIRQDDLSNKYFFTCACSKCQLGTAGREDRLLPIRSDGFDKAIEDIGNTFMHDVGSNPELKPFIVGTLPQDKDLSGLQAFAFGGVKHTDASKLSRSIGFCERVGAFDITRMPLPTLYQQYIASCIEDQLYGPALLALLKCWRLIDPVLYPQSFHPVRAVRQFNLATMARAVAHMMSEGGAQESSEGADLVKTLIEISMSILYQIRKNIDSSHGSDSTFGRGIEQLWRVSTGAVSVSQDSNPTTSEEKYAQIDRYVRSRWPDIKAILEGGTIETRLGKALGIGSI